MKATSKLTLTDINYDCLREIFKYLTPSEAFATIGIFNDVIDEVAHNRISEIKEFRINMRFPPDYPDELFQLIGSNIKSLFLTVGYSIQTAKVLSMLRPICEGASSGTLKEISIQYVDFGQGYLECLLPIARQLKVLKLCNCQLTDEILESILDTFPSLCHIDLSGNYDLSPKSRELAAQRVPEVVCENG